MAGKQAKILTNTQATCLLDFASTSRNPARNRVLALLSLKAGLRAGEISALSWPMVLDPSGEIATAIELRDHAAKKRSGRLVPIHPMLRVALEAWRLETTAAGPVIKSERGGRMTPVSIVNWFALAFRALGFEGCTSHSGRRTFITRAARMVHRAGGSLRDVQCKRPANHAFRISPTRETVCSLTGKLRGTHDESYGSFRS